MNIREKLEIPLTMLSISFLDKLPFKGSYNGIRFMFEKIKKENDTAILRLYIWKDLYNFENTDEKDIVIKEYEYTKNGIENGLDFINSYKM